MLIRLSQAGTPFVSVEDVKAHAVITTTADDELLETYILAATRLTEDRIGRILMPTEFELRTDAFYSAIDLHVAPVRAVTSVTYFDENRVLQTIPDDEYYLAEEESGAILVFVDNFSSPEISNWLDLPVRVNFTAGYEDPTASGSGDDSSLARDPMDEMIVKMLVAHWYAIREPAITGTIINEVPFSAQALIDIRRIYR